MILYFTGTGNSEFVARRIAEKTGDEIINLFEKIRTGDYSRISSKTPFVFVVPTYAWQIPHIVRDWTYKVWRKSQRLFYHDLWRQHWKCRRIH